MGRGRLPASARAARLLPVLLRGQRHRRARPGGPRDRDRALHVPAPAQGRPPVPGRLLPAQGVRRARRRRAADRHGRLRGHRADGPARGRRASSPSSSSSTASACRPPRASPSGCTGACATTSGSTSARAAATPGATRPCPDQSEHLKVERLLNISQIGMEISDGYAPIPEQSTLALISHHPQAGYYGMRNGRLLPDGSPDDVIRGTPRDPPIRSSRRCPAPRPGRPAAHGRSPTAPRASRTPDPRVADAGQ